MALNSLESSDKALFDRKYYYRQSTAQIAAEYGTTERSIEGRLYRIKRKLRKVLGGDFYDGYHSLGKVTYDTNGMVAQMLGQTSSTDVFATFSLPNEGERRRGYVM